MVVRVGVVMRVGVAAWHQRASCACSRTLPLRLSAAAATRTAAILPLALGHPDLRLRRSSILHMPVLMTLTAMPPIGAVPMLLALPAVTVAVGG